MAACGSLSSAFQTNGAFHLCGGRNVEFSNERTVAQIGGNVKFPYPGRLEYGPDPSPVINVRRVVFSSKPIEFTGIFQVQVARRKYQKSMVGYTSYTFNPKNKGSRSDPQQNMAIGFIAYDPARLLTIPEDGGIAESWHYSPDVWMLSEDRIYHNGTKEAKHNLCVYQPVSNTIGCRVNENGYLEFIMDGKNHGVVWSKPLPMDRPLWGFVDLPIEYKIQACFTYDHRLPPPYESTVRNKDEHPITSIEMTQKIAELEFGISQKVHQMQQELISTFQRQLDEHRKQLEEEFQRKHEGLREQIERFQQSLQLDLEQK